MSHSISSRSRSADAVLLVGPRWVEWLERGPGGALRQGRSDVPDSTPERLVPAIMEARRAAQAEAQGFVLALAHPLSFHRLIALPPLSRKDLAKVFERRAMALAGEARTVYYAARAMQRDEGEASQEENSCSWLIAGVRSSVRELRILLRNQLGLHARRVVSAELAALEWGRQHAPQPEQPAIVIVAGDAAVSVALTNGPRLVYEESIEGDLLARPELATGLIHELKTCTAFWKKKSRGQTVGQVAVVGLPKQRVELLALALGSILPGATVIQAGGESSEPSSRLGLFEAALASGPLDPDLTFALPLRRRQVGLAVVLTLTVALATTFLASHATERRLAELKAKVGLVFSRTADLEDLRARDEQVQARLEWVERYLQRTRLITEHGLPMERLLAGVLGAFAGRADLEELSVQPSEGGPARVTIQGHCASDPVAMVRRLRPLLDELQRSCPLLGLALTLPQNFDDETEEQSAFTIGGYLEV